MSLGVLNNIAAIYAQNNLNQTQNSLQNVLQQLSSGSRINSGADDAAGLALADGLHANEAALTQSSMNATSGVGLLQTADGALAQVTNLLNRAVTLATEAANGTLNSSQIGSANQEYQNILAEIGDIGSTTNFNGNTVFTGTSTSVFVSDGTATGATTYNEVIGVLSTSSVGTTAGAVAVLSALKTGASTDIAASPTTSTAITTGSSTSTAIPAPLSSVDITPPAAGTGTQVITMGAPTDTVSGAFSMTVAGGTAVTANLASGTSLTDAATQLTAAFAAAGDSTVTVAADTTAGTLTITDTNAADTLDMSASTLKDESIPAGTATLTMGAGTDTISGAFSMSVAGGAAVTATLAAGTSLTDAATQLNAAFVAAGNTTMTVAADTTAGTLTFTDTTTTDTLDMSASTLSDTATAPLPTGTATLSLAADTDTISGGFSLSVNGGTAITATIAANTTIADAVTQLNAAISASGNTTVTAAQGTGAASNTIVFTDTTAADTLDLGASTLNDGAAGAPPVGTATLSLAADTDAISGSFSLSIAGGTAITATIAANTTIADAVKQINAAISATGNTTVTAAQGTGANSNKIVLTDTTATDTLDMSASSLKDTGNGGTVPKGTATLTVGADTDTINGTFSLSVAGGAAITATLGAGTTLAAATAKINQALVAAGNTTVTAAQGTGAAANTIVFTDTNPTDTLDMSGSNLTQTVPAGAALAGVDFTGTNAALSAGNATAVLTSVTSAIQDVDFQRGNLGASINELNAASNVASAESVNLTSAEDSVRSTNYGQATSDMAKFQVLSQTGIAALSQANSVQQEILKLLQ
jgi:flagellin